MENYFRKHSLELALILAITLLIFLFYGCGGTRSVTTEKQSNITVSNNYQEGSKIVLGNSFTYTPFDSAKPMIIDSIVYKNVIIKSTNLKVVEKWKDRNIIKTISIEKNKQTEKKDNTILWIGLSFVICLFVFLWFYLKKDNIFF